MCHFLHPSLPLKTHHYPNHDTSQLDYNEVGSTLSNHHIQSRQLHPTRICGPSHSWVSIHNPLNLSSPYSRNLSRSENLHHPSDHSYAYLD